MCAGVTWGADVVVWHPADARLAAMPPPAFNPWAAEAAGARPVDGAGRPGAAAPGAVGGEAPGEAAPPVGAAPPPPPAGAGAARTRPAGAGAPAVGRILERVVTAPSRSEELQRLLRKAEQLHLTGPLGADDGAGDGETPLAAALRLGVRDRARETWDVGRLDTALTWFAEFAEDAERVPMFKELGGLDDVAALVYNQTSLDMFGEYLRRRGSRLKGPRAGVTLRADTISAYVSTIKSLRTAEARHRITDPRANTIGPAAAKRMRQLDGPPGQRQLRLGLRARHLRAIAAAGFVRFSKRGAQQWAAAVLAHNLLLRGGEVGVVDSAEFDTARDLTIGAVEFKAPCAESAWLPWLTVDVVPIKDVHARRRVCPMPVRRRGSGGELGGDPMDVYDAIVLAIAARIGRLPPTLGRVGGPEAMWPLFTRARGGAWRTADTRALARDFAQRLGLDPNEFGAKSFRVGGATDWRAVFGPRAAEAIIRQRGRWCSDVAAIYQRALADEHLSGSAAVGGADGAELEALCRGWAQPASFR